MLPASWLIAALASSSIACLQWFGLLPDTSLIASADLGQAYGNLRQRNQFATLTTLGLAAVLARGRTTWTASCALVWLACGNAASTSRTGLLQWVLLSMAFVLWPGPRLARIKLAAVAGSAYALATQMLPALFEMAHGFAPPNVFDRIEADLGCSSRKVLWSNVLQLIAQRPWTGWGLGELDYAHYSTLYSGPRFCEILDNAHNLPLHLAVELGVPIAVLACVVVVGWILRNKPWTEGQGDRQLAWAALLGIGIHSMLEYPLWYGPFQIAVLGSILLLHGPELLGVQHRGLAMAMLAAIVLGAGLLQFEYDRVSQPYLPPEQRRPSARQDPIATAGTPIVFSAQLRFAELSLTPLTSANAESQLELALAMLHFSPEPIVIEKVIESASSLGRMEVAATHVALYRAAFPARFAEWALRQGAVIRPNEAQ